MKLLQPLLVENRTGDMLMKKILSLLLILAMLTVAMVSCKKDEPTETPVTPDPPAQETRYTITAEEWAAVCALTNFTATQAGSAVYTSGDVTETEETFAEFKYTATVNYRNVQEAGDPIYEEYYALIDGRILNIRLLGTGAFEADVTDRTELDNFAEAFEFDGVTFDTLTYNAEAKAYVDAEGAVKVLFTDSFSMMVIQNQKVRNQLRAALSVCLKKEVGESALTIELTEAQLPDDDGDLMLDQIIQNTR